MENRKLIEVAVAAPLEKTFYYTVPEEFSSRAVLGMKVTAPFGKRAVTGYIVGYPDVHAVTKEGGSLKIKDIKDIPDITPSFTPTMLEFYRWIADYYISSLGEVIRTALPGTKGTVKKERFVSIILSADESGPMTPKEKSVLDYVKARERVAVKELNAEFKRPTDVIRRLSQKGMVLITEEEVSRSPYKQWSGVKGIKGQGNNAPVLSETQESAFSAIKEAMDKDGFSPFLLHGVTGSGKTEIYLRVIEHGLGRGKGAIVLVPEISLTPQLLNRFRSRFGDKVAALHSALSDGERFDEWRRIKSGEARIVVGARSAVFAPVEDLGILVVDEEHDHSYKQEESLRYNARDLALVRGKMVKGVVILGSATPSMESYHNAKSGKSNYLNLPVRVEERPMPKITLVDMKDTGKRQIFSSQMTESLQKSIAEKKQALLFLNRRGFSTFLICSDCGYTFGCPNCSISLIYHQGDGTLKCHYCDYEQKAFPLCPRCKGGDVGRLGLGTEKVEEEVKKAFPDVRVARMDRDTVSRKGSHERILKRMEDGDVDILVGTQMVTKGHDYPNITMVGVISADISLNLPDFRAAERTFQLITQVAGRAGRGDTPGTVVIQTFSPDHYAIHAAATHDMNGFYKEETSFRKELGYPPFARLISIKIRGSSEAGTAKAAEKLGRISDDELREWKGITVLGPSQAPIYKIRGKYRWHMLVKGKDSGKLHSFVRALLLKAGGRSGLRGAEVQVDVDPLSMV